MRLKFLAGSAFALLLTLPAAPARAQADTTNISFDFRDGQLGWQAGFADYPPATDVNNSYDLRAELRTLPPELGVSGNGFFVHGVNHSDDLYMFIRRRLTAADGIVAGQKYRIVLTITFASNAQSGCLGVGGSPGEGVGLNAWAYPNEPRPFLDGSGWLRMNVNVRASSAVGDIANGQPCGSVPPSYVSLRKTSQRVAEVTATSDGVLWLLVGTNSGFEGPTAIYYQRIDAQLVPVGAPSPSVPVLLTDENTGRAIVFDSVTMLNDPLPRDTSFNFAPDRRTRLMLFASNVALADGEGASAVSARIEDIFNKAAPLAVEYVGKVPGYDWLTQLVVRLPDEVSDFSPQAWVSISVHGAASNAAKVLIKPALAASARARAQTEGNVRPARDSRRRGDGN